MSTFRTRTNKVQTTGFFFTGILLTILTTACAIPGWNNELKSFVETGLSTVYLKSVSYTQGGSVPNADVLPGTPVIVTVLLHNPKELALSYTLTYPASLVSGSVDAPSDTTAATDGITTVTFIFTPTPDAELKNVTFSLGMHASDLNRNMVPASIPVRCDSPPGLVGHLTAGLQNNGKAGIGFTLPEGYADSDISAVEITYISPSLSPSKTETISVSPAGTDLTAVPMPALLNSNAGAYVRYFLTADVIAGNPCSFTVTLIDARAHRGTTSPSVGVTGTERYLGYDGNGGTGSVASSYGFNASTTTIADGSSLSRFGYTFTGWNTIPDGSGLGYAQGDNYTFGSGNRILYAQWSENSAIPINTAAELAAMQSDLAGHYFLTGDIDLSSIPNWTPVGSLSNPFTGNFNGNRYTIFNLSVTTASGDAGLFGYITGSALIYDLHLKNISVTGGYSPADAGSGTNNDGVGGIVGEKGGGTVSRCSVSGTVTGYERVGGIVGNNRSGDITKCYSTATVTATSQVAGGLVSSNWGSISDCYAKCAVSSPNYVGGLLGKSETGNVVANCYSSGTVTLTTVNKGGLVGNGTSSNSYYDSTISGLTETSSGIPQTSTQLQTQATYTGWDFSNVWAIVPGINGGYPYLRDLPVPVVPLISSLTISAGEPRLFQGWAGHDSEQITATILPTSASGNALSWTSSVPGVATVDANGIVTAVSAGTTTIMATATDGSGFDGICTVSVPEELFFHTTGATIGIGWEGSWDLSTKTYSVTTAAPYGHLQVTLSEQDWSGCSNLYLVMSANTLSGTGVIKIDQTYPHGISGDETSIEVESSVIAPGALTANLPFTGIQERHVQTVGFGTNTSGSGSIRLVGLYVW